MKRLDFVNERKTSVSHKQRGFGVIQLMALMSVSMLTILALMGLSTQLLKSGSQMADLAELETLARSVVAYVADQNMWATRIRPMNGSMGCLPGGTCAPFNPISFARYNAFGNLISGVQQPLVLDDGLVQAGMRGIRINNAIPTWGYTLSGAFCTTYGQAPFSRCPAKIMANWYATSTKPYPIVAITVRVIIHPTYSGIQVGTGRMSFDTGTDQPGPVVYRASY